MKTTLKYLSVTVVVTMLCMGMTCPKANTVAFKTLYGVEVATTGAYDAYILAAVMNAVSTNSFPAVSHSYNAFHTTMNFAVKMARGDSNAVAPAYVISAGKSVIDSIQSAKGGN